MIYDEQVGPLSDDSLSGYGVALLGVADGRVDKNFRLNYAWAKHAADNGKLTDISVVVLIGNKNWVHTVSAVKSAIGGVPLHPAARFQIKVDVGGSSVVAGNVADALVEYSAPVVETVADKTGVRSRRSQAKDDNKGE
ncbi:MULTISPECIES: hypothetical protein [Mycobacteroides]|uniref:hypothetical protein n=1 Tax=Mycobacteroides TaxID=670516 RepID=UPI0009258808|nr:hypothetical protein [Mycobacteroides abscessus]SHT27371.1 Uncharacterised protein [Mycobacteroides abscessus subsp. abscessus]SHW70448.1 Uncharacterised protein [Mycobacteroides abscessus subsp. abscessus]SHY72929.1 Uncharacterised protein [Mycobacteroides abscessus subsp. abscessus]SHZ41587.1 Uncharacterised protein [Mycobacteroides abscessus subsp. abscessus]SKR90678.1 Uncharacterised protein [Mycobacteroides abscessus subsp. abscessus]